MFEKIRRFFLHYGLSVCVALTILYLCMKPSSGIEHMDIPYSDKIGHFLMYFGLTLCICFNLYKEHTQFKSVEMIAWGIIIPILYGGLIEVMQGELTLTRSCDIYDLMADAIGCIAGYFAALIFIPRFCKENED